MDTTSKTKVCAHSKNAYARMARARSARLAQPMGVLTAQHAKMGTTCWALRALSKNVYARMAQARTARLAQRTGTRNVQRAKMGTS